MTASIPKQDPNTWKIKKNTVYYDKTQHANFQGNPLFQATKPLEQQLSSEKWDIELRHLPGFGWAVLFSCPVLGRICLTVV